MTTANQSPEPSATSATTAAGKLEPGAAMLTDLYELTMAAAYHEAGMNYEATFELAVRRLPSQRRFLVMAGLDDVLSGLEHLTFTSADLAYLNDLGKLPAGFLEILEGFRFTGELWAMPEGEVVFDGEPLVRVTAPFIEAQVVETFLLNQIASSTMLASKAARIALACGDERSFVDFSARRDHGASAAMTAARSAWIAGASGTSLVAAGHRWGIPLSGTMAHSFVMSFDDERDAFRTYARAFPRDTVLLVDTYDTLQGVENAIEVAHELAPEGIEIGGVRLDSGDLNALAVEARRMLNQAGLSSTRIIASGDLDEHRIADLVAQDAPIDAFGVGTQLGTSGDAPSLGAVYKLVEDARRPRMKLAADKVTMPGRKQVWRFDDRDVVGLHDEDLPGGRPLLQQVMAGGKRSGDGSAWSAGSARDRCREALGSLHPALRPLEPFAPARDSEGGPERWRVDHSDGLQTLAEELRASLARSAQVGA